VVNPRSREAAHLGDATAARHTSSISPLALESMGANVGVPRHERALNANSGFPLSDVTASVQTAMQGVKRSVRRPGSTGPPCNKSHARLQSLRPMKNRNEERGAFEVSALVCAVFTAVCLLPICTLVAVVGCGGRSEGSSRSATVRTDRRAQAGLSRSTTRGSDAARSRDHERAPRLSGKHARRRGRTVAARACRRFGDAASALHRMLVRARRVQARRPLDARRALMLQAGALPAAARSGSAGGRLAAALFAVERPVERRQAAFAGCAAALEDRE
jgi:hypothetical protein